MPAFLAELELAFINRSSVDSEITQFCYIKIFLNASRQIFFERQLFAEDLPVV